MTYTAQDFGTEIKNRFPLHSPIHDETNLGAILIDDSIGAELSNIEAWIFANSDARFLGRATGTYLDKYGAWFGLPRAEGMSDDDYRTQLISFRGSDITITGLKTAISTILNFTNDDVSISNTYPNYCTVGGVIYANYLSGTPCKLSGNYNVVNKTLTITVPFDHGDILSDLIENMIIPGVTVNISYTNMLIDNVSSGTDDLGDTTGFTTYNGCSIESSSSYSKYGDKSLHVTFDAQPMSVVTIEGITTTPELTYKTSVWIKAPEDEIIVMWFNDSGWNVIGETTQITGNGEFQELTLESTNPVDSSIDRITMVQYSNTEVIEAYIDGIAFYPV